MNSYLNILVLGCMLYLLRHRGSIGLLTIVLSILVGILCLVANSPLATKATESFAMYLIVLWIAFGVVVVKNKHSIGEED